MPAGREGSTRPMRSRRRSLVRYYRTADRYHRYTTQAPDRTRDLARLVRRLRRYLGHDVLDLGCGGGVLGYLLEGSGRRYVGVDTNPDMIRAARASAASRGSTQRFVLADASRARLRGRFDTFAVLGNTLGHWNPREFSDLLRARARNAAPGACFLIEYRDVVGLFWRRNWSGRLVQVHKAGRIVHRTVRVDFETGEVWIRARPSRGAWSATFTQAVWSPFILETLMASHGWRRVARWPERPPGKGRVGTDLWVDVYRKGSGSRRGDSDRRS